MTAIPFQTINWSTVKPTEHKGETGMATWQTQTFGSIRIRRVVYSPGYMADHWCQKGHIIHCLSGSMISELADGTKHELSAGMTYIVSDYMSSHRSVSKDGVELLITDGDFLNLKG